MLCFGSTVRLCGQKKFVTEPVLVLSNGALKIYLRKIYRYLRWPLSLLWANRETCILWPEKMNISEAIKETLPSGEIPARRWPADLTKQMTCSISRLPRLPKYIWDTGIIFILEKNWKRRLRRNKEYGTVSHLYKVQKYFVKITVILRLWSRQSQFQAIFYCQRDNSSFI